MNVLGCILHQRGEFFTPCQSKCVKKCPLPEGDSRAGPGRPLKTGPENGPVERKSFTLFNQTHFWVFLRLESRELYVNSNIKSAWRGVGLFFGCFIDKNQQIFCAKLSQSRFFLLIAMENFIFSSSRFFGCFFGKNQRFFCIQFSKSIFFQSFAMENLAFSRNF